MTKAEAELKRQEAKRIELENERTSGLGPEDNNDALLGLIRKRLRRDGVNLEPPPANPTPRFNNLRRQLDHAVDELRSQDVEDMEATDPSDSGSPDEAA